MGMPIPDAIRNAPIVTRGLDFFYDAFWELCSSRPVGFGIGHIPWHFMLQYAQYHELSYEETEEFIYLLRKMDREYVEYNSTNK